MDEVKDKMKGLMKKVNNPFSSSSSSKFKGQGRVLGSGPSPSSPTSTTARPPPPRNPIPSAAPASKTSSKSLPADSVKPHSLDGFDPFHPLLSSGDRRPASADAVPSFDCPVCGGSFPTADDVAAHLDSCLAPAPDPDGDVAGRVVAYMSGRPQPEEASEEVVMKLLRNVVREPGNEKFRRIRMANPRISSAVGDVEGGVELLECLGFLLREEGGEMWAVMDVPSEQGIGRIKEAVALLERLKPVDIRTELKSPSSMVTSLTPQKPKELDRKVRVFFPVPESVAAAINLPDSFYDLSAAEIKREAMERKKKIEESKILIPKSFREKQAAGRKNYKATVIRIQFPDGVLLQGVFLPQETTTMLYEFVSSALKEQNLEFELLQPVKLHAIPHLPSAGERIPTLEDLGLVPSALLRFRPVESESSMFTGLSNELLEASEPLTSMTALR